MNYAKNSMHMTHRWLEKCVKRFKETECAYGYSQTLFPIVQGSVYRDLRKESAEFIASMDMEGNAIGGLSVGEPDDELYEMTELVCSILPQEKPRYLMGVGTPANILEGIALGVDMFDCVMPTRNGRNAMLFTTKGVVNIDNKKWEHDFSPIDDGLPCEVSNYYSKAYLRHLMKAKEFLGLTIASIHNLAFYTWLMDQARTHIRSGDFAGWKKEMSRLVKTRC
jgi:queuine tRNA-ribosyltransferase